MHEGQVQSLLPLLLLLLLGHLGRRGHGGHPADHDSLQALQEGNTGQALALVEGLAHKGPLGPPDDRGGVASLQAVGPLVVLINLFDSLFRGGNELACR